MPGKGKERADADVELADDTDVEIADATKEAADLDRHERDLSAFVPRPIQRLEEAVVNRIAAGEIIQRPANALKELIENSLDAGATMIRVTLRDGGLKMLQIQDNGHGVSPADLPLLCERFATSKLRNVDDLMRMTTFGFRGEALASISYVTASMSVVSKTKDSQVGHKAFYSDGKLVPPKPGQSSAPKVCAATDGTTITAEDLFYNAPQRRRALSSNSEEYNRCLDVIGRYAVHFGGRGVGFLCKRAGTSMTDLSTTASPENTTFDTIRLLHGQSIARELTRLKPLRDAELDFSVEGWVSGANWSAKKTTMLCFINHRLVDCPSLRKAIEALYATLLPKGRHPWLYISLEIAPDKVDVNVHPTKREVHFLNEDDVIEAICVHLQACLVGANQSRTFQFSQMLLPGASEPAAATQTQKANPRHSVRTDSDMQTLDAHVVRLERSDSAGQKRARASSDVDEEEDVGDRAEAPIPSTQRLPPTQSRSNRIKESECSLRSVSELRATIAEQRHRELCDIIQSHTFVGVVDLDKGLSLIQHLTKLYLVNHNIVIEEFAYQLIVRQFGNFERVRLDPPVVLRDLIRIGIKADESFSAGGFDEQKAIKKIARILTDRSEMLEEYFGIAINDDGEVTHLPTLLPRHFPLPLDNLPQLFTRLGPQVDWETEKPCLDGIARELAYACVPILTDPDDKTEAEGLQWIIEHVWFANMLGKRGAYAPSQAVQARAISQVAAMSDLYRVFERC